MCLKRQDVYKPKMKKLLILQDLLSQGELYHYVSTFTEELEDSLEVKVNAPSQDSLCFDIDVEEEDLSATVGWVVAYACSLQFYSVSINIYNSKDL